MVQLGPKVVKALLESNVKRSDHLSARQIAELFSLSPSMDLFRALLTGWKSRDELTTTWHIEQFFEKSDLKKQKKTEQKLRTVQLDLIASDQKLIVAKVELRDVKEQLRLALKANAQQEPVDPRRVANEYVAKCVRGPDGRYTEVFTKAWTNFAKHAMSLNQAQDAGVAALKCFGPRTPVLLP